MPVMAKKKQPAQDRHKKRTHSMRLDERLMEQVRVLAERNRRTVTTEVTIALEEYLAKNGLWPQAKEGGNS